MDSLLHCFTKLPFNYIYLTRSLKCIGTAGLLCIVAGWGCFHHRRYISCVVWLDFEWLKHCHYLVSGAQVPFFINLVYPISLSFSLSDLQVSCCLSVFLVYGWLLEYSLSFTLFIKAKNFYTKQRVFHKVSQLDFNASCIDYLCFDF